MWLCQRRIKTSGLYEEMKDFYSKCIFYNLLSNISNGNTVRFVTLCIEYMYIEWNNIVIWSLFGVFLSRFVFISMRLDCGSFDKFSFNSQIDERLRDAEQIKCYVLILNQKQSFWILRFCDDTLLSDIDSVTFIYRNSHIYNEKQKKKRTKTKQIKQPSMAYSMAGPLILWNVRIWKQIWMHK